MDGFERNSDDDRTSPDLGDEEGTQPGVGVSEAYVAISVSIGRVVDSIQTLSGACPKRGEAGRERHLEGLVLLHGDLGMLAFDIRRVTLALIREERDP